jgi:hypothetical protein
MLDKLKKAWHWFDGKKRDIGGLFTLGALYLPSHTVAYQVCFVGSTVFNILGWSHAGLKTEKGKKLASGLSDKLKKK